jgi:hypothetical protein
MTTITDEFMQAMLATVHPYCVVILKAGPHKHAPGAAQLLWEHGRRNFLLRAQGLLAIVCPIADGSEIAGIGIFTAPIDDVRRLMDTDPAVQAGVLVYELHPCRSFPGDCLPR